MKARLYTCYLASLLYYTFFTKYERNIVPWPTVVYAECAKEIKTVVTETPRVFDTKIIQYWKTDKISNHNLTPFSAQHLKTKASLSQSNRGKPKWYIVGNQSIVVLRPFHCCGPLCTFWPFKKRKSVVFGLQKKSPYTRKVTCLDWG